MAGERGWVERWVGSLREPANVRVGPGDDGAVVRLPGRDAVLVCDPVVEGVHFRRDDPPARVGHKAVHRNLADLAAMGARPEVVLLSLVLRKGTTAARRRALAGGVALAAEAAGCPLVGGDVAVHDGPTVATVTAIGSLVGRPLRRDGARGGDRLFVTGPLGGSLLGGHLRFEAPLEAGAWLAHQRSTGGVIDVSDGLVLDLDRVLRASGGLGAVLDGESIPIATAARRRARSTRRSALAHALADGEDHVLLFTWHGRRPPGLEGAVDIGEVVTRPGIRLREGGRTRRLDPSKGGFQHEL